MTQKTLLILSLLIATPAFADCTPEHLSEEDLAIMASVRPATLSADTPRIARAERILIHGLHDDLGRVGPDDLSQIRSVQPEGALVAACIAPRNR